MLESFVEVRYQHVELSRRAKLCHVTPHHGYLEVALPMPVGTVITLTTDEKVSITVTVTRIHEQIAGAAQPPGMSVAPHFVEADALSWWAARVTEVSEPMAAAMAEPAALMVANHAVVDDGRSTILMKAFEFEAGPADEASQSKTTMEVESQPEPEPDQSASMAEAAKKKPRRSKRRVVT